MSDVIARFLEDPPRRVRLKDEWWSLSIVSTRPKSSRHWALIACCESDHREHLVCSGITIAAVRDKALEGFHVKSGTPLRGIVTELRRQGVMELMPTRPRPTV